MKKDNFKKIIIISLILFFLLSFYFPINTKAAESLSLQVSKYELKEGETIIITANSSLNNKKINFFSSPSASFNPDGCTTTGAITAGSFSCQVNLKPSTNGDYEVYATTNYNGILKSETIKLKVEKGKTVLSCEPPKKEINGICKEPDATIPGGDNGNTNNSSKETDTNYTLLAPLPGFPESFDTKIDETNNPCPFGNYMNIVLKLVIGIVIVLAVIMIVSGGIEYMTSELVSSKEAGRGTITHAILGILIALGAVLLLQTINPDLLNMCLNKLPTAEITIEPETEFNPWEQMANLTNPTDNCKEGYTNVTTFGQPSLINVCRSISVNLDKMLKAAKKENIILTGYGSRTKEQQIQLRRQHNCPNVFISPANQCVPPTARPGLSRHEAGKAVDFRCNGKSMVEAGGKNSPCFKWLAIHAAKEYGFYNLESEVWHWSDNGN